jgi:hypothetical protein
MRVRADRTRTGRVRDGYGNEDGYGYGYRKGNEPGGGRFLTCAGPAGGREPRYDRRTVAPARRGELLPENPGLETPGNGKVTIGQRT